MRVGTYGTHLIVRLSQIELNDALDTPDMIAGYLTTLVARIGMRVLAGPLVAQEGGPAEREGYSGVVILYESHAAIHTYPHLQEAFIDVFSCRPFDIPTVMEITTEFFGTFHITEQSVFDRGIHWGVDIQREIAAWSSLRGS